jgi:hypothetical protein
MEGGDPTGAAAAAGTGEVGAGAGAGAAVGAGAGAGGLAPLLEPGIRSFRTAMFSPAITPPGAEEAVVAAAAAAALQIQGLKKDLI